jgi:hypothetical protein
MNDATLGGGEASYDATCTCRVDLQRVIPATLLSINSPWLVGFLATFVLYIRAASHFVPKCQYAKMPFYIRFFMRR